MKGESPLGEMFSGEITRDPHVGLLKSGRLKSGSMSHVRSHSSGLGPRAWGCCLVTSRGNPWDVHVGGSHLRTEDTTLHAKPLLG